MMSNVYHILKERGFLYQTTDDEMLEKMLGQKKVTCYIGFDATADSLHIGSLVPIMALMHMQQAGHKPIALLGGGTTMVGDPSGKTEMRKMLTLDQIRAFGEGIQKQFSQYLNFSDGKAMMVNNADWLVPLNYIEFLREVGVHFSINRMLTAESVKQRLESGLSFIEFNYMLLQAYDFYVLARDHECILQMGGQDQWGNIVAGSDLTRRKLGKQVYGMTFPLITTSSGEKFGKSAGNAIWLDKNKTPVFDFYQYFRNADDRDITKYLGLFTLLPMDEAHELPKRNINRAKEILAYEVTRLAHGKKEAEAAYTASVRQFGQSDPAGEISTSSDILEIKLDASSTVPTITLLMKELEKGIWIVKLFMDAELCGSNGEIRRLIKQGGAYLNDEKITNDSLEVKPDALIEDALLLRAGKKRYKRVVFE